MKTRITIKPYVQLPTHNPEEFLRTVGLPQDYFWRFIEQLEAYLDEKKALNPLIRREPKGSNRNQPSDAAPLLGSSR